ncbi:hypothetical protein [Bradyrhizobium paxllaeri]|uniref:hypothetical protein n=1 Tax=Bradyrhizobium paxllaeri TaxID=190148 RepID=UPI001146AFB4|nr:hypothetical protein [Bradyrhizobium paxllaeri]
MMRTMILLGAVAMLLLFAPANPASAQHVITNPGKCAQFYPNANCQNYGRGNPYTAYGWQRSGYRHYGGHRYHRRHWR